MLVINYLVTGIILSCIILHNIINLPKFNLSELRAILTVLSTNSLIYHDFTLINMHIVIILKEDPL